MKINIEYYKRRLTSRRSELLDLVDTTSSSAAPVELDPQVQGRLSRMDAIQGQAMAQATNQRRRIEVSQIDAALKRIEFGEFGCCVVCGEEISLKRLDLSPAIARCVECAE